MILGMVMLGSALSFFLFVCLFVWPVFNMFALFVEREEVKGKYVVQYLHVFEQL